MQYLKFNVKQQIIASALKQFKENGYRGASMRDIAADANIVTGNIYRYYKNKEELFDSIIEPTYNLVLQVQKHYDELLDKPEKTAQNPDFNKLIRQIEDEILGIFAGHAIELSILLEKSDGTKYADTKDIIKQIIFNTMQKIYLPSIQKQGKKVEDNFILYVLSSSFVDGVCLILKKSDNEQNAKEMIDYWTSVILYDLQLRL